MLTTSSFAQEKFKDAVYSKGGILQSGYENYYPHLADQSQRFEVGLGAGYSGDFGVTFHGGYHLSHRVNVTADLLVDPHYGFLDLNSSILYTYEAIPSLRGGFFFNIGFSAGIGTYKFDDFYPFLGPAVGVKHHISDHFALASRVSYNVLEPFTNLDCFPVNSAVTLLYLF